MSGGAGPCRSSILMFQDAATAGLRGFTHSIDDCGVCSVPTSCPASISSFPEEEKEANTCNAGSASSGISLYYNPAAVSQPGPFELGNAGRKYRTCSRI